MEPANSPKASLKSGFLTIDYAVSNLHRDSVNLAISKCQKALWSSKQW